MPSVSSYFWDQCQNKTFGRDEIVRRVSYGGLGPTGAGSFYLDDRIHSLSRLTQNAQKPIFPDYRVGISNRDLAMNHLVSSRWVGQGLTIELGFMPAPNSYDTLVLFKGFGRELQGDQVKIDIQAEGKFAHLTRDKVGATNSPVIFAGSSWNPADLFWTVAVSYGGLDSTASISNADMDYAAWADWKSGAADFGITVQGRLENVEVLKWMQSLGEISDAWIYETQARLSFQFFSPVHPESFSPILLTEAHYNHFAEVEIRDQVSQIEVFNRFDAVSKVWIPTSPVVAINSAAAAAYGTLVKRYDNEMVWHSSSGSAAQFAERKSRNFKAGIKLFTITGEVPLWPFDLGDRVLFSCGSWGVNSSAYQVSGKTINPKTRETTLHLEGSEQWTSWFFLDDAVYGLLDQDYNPIY